MGLLLIATAAVVLAASQARAQGVTPEVEACQASGLIALKEKTPAIKNVIIEPPPCRRARPTPWWAPR